MVLITEICCRQVSDTSEYSIIDLSLWNHARILVEAG